MKSPFVKSPLMSIAAVVAVLALTTGGAAADPMSVAEHARESLAAATLAEALAAAAGGTHGSLPIVDTPELEPVASGAIEPNQAETVEADDLGATVEFSGYKVDESLDVTVSKLLDATATSAESELSATALTTPFEVTALTDSGKEVTDFPADATIEKVPNAPDVVTDVRPGVALDIAVDPAAVEGLDPSSLRIVTREEEGQPWVEIPSFYDAASGSVKGEIDHLSQFVVIGTPFVPPPGPRIVLDPDDNVGHTTGPGGPMTELPENVQLANALATSLTEGCLADVLVTRTTAAPDFLSQSIRAGMAASHNPDLTLTVAFNAFIGSPWGDDTDGGTIAYSRGGAADDALQASLVTQLPGYTGRPAHGASSAAYPYSEFNGVPGAMAHLETLFIDHNFDRPVIDNGFQHIVDGVFTGIGMYLETQGFDCTDPVTGGWPARPSDAELAKWRNLGYQNYLTYGGDPVSFSTGNLVEDEPIFTLSGVGGQALDLTLVYNSQDGRLGRVGAGWTFGLGARAQRFDDGSVMVVRGDGASFVFNPNGTGGYTTEDGLHLVLTEAAGGELLLTAADGESWLFDAADIEGIGELAVHTDRQGNSYSLGYASPDADDQFVPLASITDQAGQVIQVGHDANGRISSFTHPDGRVWSLGYGAAGDLESITGPDGRVRTFTYDATHEMLSATDASGVTYLVNEFDASGRVVKQWDADHNLRTFDYDIQAGVGGDTTYTDNEGNETVFSFDEKSRITDVTDALGQAEHYTYDANNQVVKYTDQRGESTLYEYDANGNVTKKTTADGAVTQYTYTPTGEVASITDQGGTGGAARTTTFAVDSHGLTTGVTRPDGSQLANAFDAHGDLTVSTDPAGGTSTFAYDARGNLASLTDQLGRVTSFTYDLANRLVSATDADGGVTTFAWDAGDRLVTQTDAAGGVTSFTYDANDHPLTRTDPDGAVTTYVWDDLFRVVSVTAPDGGVTSYDYNTEDELVKTTDALGHVTTMTLDDLYRLVTVTDANGGSWTRQYDPTGNLTAATDPLGATTHYAYDPLGRLTAVTDATGAVSHTSYDPVGRTTAEQDALGQTVGYKYDVLDRLVRTTDQSGAQTQYAYDPLGNVTQTIDRRGNTTSYDYDAASHLQSWSGPVGTGSSFDYDGRGNTVASTDALGRTSTLVYDALSRPVSAVDPLGDTSTVGYDPVGRVIASTDPNGNTTHYAYDLAGRLTSAIDPLGNTTTHVWNALGQQTKMTDPTGSATTYAYDPVGQLTAVTEGYVPLPAPAGTDVNVTTQYQYTATGNVSKITDPVGAVTQFQYDVLGRTTQETNPLGKVWHYSYDALGRPTQEVDAKNQTTSYQYTSRSDVSQVHYADGSQVTYQYDQAQNLIAMTDSIGASGWIYDAAGRMTKQTDSLGAVLQHAYDTTGAETKMTLPGGQQVSYQYDGAGRPIRVTSSSGSLAYAYDAASNLTNVLRSTGVTSTYAYDADNRVTGIQHTSPGAELGCDLGANDLEVGVDIDTLVDLNICLTVDIDVPVLTGLDYGDSITLGYTYDGAGDVATQTRKDGSATTVSTAYSYDRLHRLTASTSSNTVNNSYQYDKAGNRTKWVTNKAPDTGAALTVSATYNGAGQLTSESKVRPGLLGPSTIATSYTYDNNGNRTKAQTGITATTYKYTPDDKLAEVNQPGRKVTTQYDGLGHALAETVTSLLVLGETTTQVWDGMQVVQKTGPLTGTSNLLRDAATGDVAIQTGGLLAGGTKWGLTDRLGSTIGQTSGSKVGQIAKYSDWGVPTFATAGWNSKTGYTGELGDATTGLDLFYARAYEPMSGSWLSADPYRGTNSDPSTLARYAYAGGNPTTFADLYGYVTGKSVGGGSKAVGKGYAAPTRAASDPTPKTPSGNGKSVSARHDPGLNPLQIAGAILGLAGQAVATMYLNTARTLVNGLASLGNAMVNHLDQVGAIALGALLVVAGAAGEVGGVALDATGVGALAGVPAAILSAGAITAGIAAIGAASAALGAEAAGNSKVEPWKNESDSGSINPRDIHGADRSGREVDEQYVQDNGDLYFDDGNLVRVLDNKNGTYDVVIRDPSNPTGKPITTIKNMTDKEFQKKIDSGDWWSN